MFTKFVKMLVKAKVRMTGHCDDGASFGHCAYQKRRKL